MRWTKLRGHKFGFFGKGIQIFISSLWEISLPMLRIWKRISTLKLYSNFKTWKEILLFFVECCVTNLQTYEKSLHFHTCTTLMQNRLGVMEMGLSTLVRACHFAHAQHSFPNKNPLSWGFIPSWVQIGRDQAHKAWEYLQRAPMQTWHITLWFGIQCCIEMDNTLEVSDGEARQCPFVHSIYHTSLISYKRQPTCTWY